MCIFQFSFAFIFFHSIVIRKYVCVCVCVCVCMISHFLNLSCFCCSVWCILENIPCAFENKIYPTVVLGWTVRYSWITMFSLLSFFLCVYLWIFFLPPLQFYWDIIFINMYEFKAYHVLIWYTYILQNEYHHWVGLYLHHLTQLQLFFV